MSDVGASVAVYCTANADYVVPSLIALSSVRRFHPEHAYFIVADRARLRPGQAALIASLGVELVHLDGGGTLLNGLGASGDEAHLTRECYWKFAGPSLFQARGFDYSMAIDGDVLCVRPLDLAWVLPDVQCYAGIRRMGSPRRWGFRYPRWVQSHYRVGHEAMDGDFTNTGVLIWNNRRAVEFGVLERAVVCYRDGSRVHPRMFRVADQSLFSLVTELDPPLHWLVLPGNYNFRVNSDGDRRRLRNPAEIRLIHYTGPKPWRRDSLSDCVANADKPFFRHRLAFKSRWTSFVERSTPFWRDLSLKGPLGRRLARGLRLACEDLTRSLIMSDAGTALAETWRIASGAPRHRRETGWRRG